MVAIADRASSEPASGWMAIRSVWRRNIVFRVHQAHESDRPRRAASRATGGSSMARASSRSDGLASCVSRTRSAAPAATNESVELGKKLYEENGCVKCHGNLGRGDGPSATTLMDDYGYPIRAADLTQPWTFRGGPSRGDMFRTMTTGLNGAPMPSFGLGSRYMTACWIEAIGCVLPK